MDVRKLSLAVAISVMLTPVAQATEPTGRITGVGGIFIRSKNPKALMAWYRDKLGITLEDWGGATLRYDAPDHPPVVTLNAFSQTSSYMKPSVRDFMINFAVDDMSAFIDRLKGKGVAVLARDDSDPSGSFAWILDPRRYEDRIVATEDGAIGEVVSHGDAGRLIMIVES